MALDIVTGDIYVVGSDEYPIRSCAAWSWGYGRAMKRLLKVDASTKRQPVISGGKRGAPATNLTGLRSTPLDPLSPEIAERLALETPHTLLQTFVDGGDVFYDLVLEDLKR